MLKKSIWEVLPRKYGDEVTILNMICFEFMDFLSNSEAIKAKINVRMHSKGHGKTEAWAHGGVFRSSPVRTIYWGDFRGG